MSSNPCSSPIPPAASPPVPPSPPSTAPFLRSARILLARNPFYIISAALLLWSMRSLSLDSRIFDREFPQLLFNFSSFQFYELLLAGTAIALARRRIWYDSGLLVALENLFLCVPFLLVSQALLLENQIAFALCFSVCALAVVRFRAMRRELPGFNLPPALLFAGLSLLAFNLGWPVLIRHLHQSRDLPVWDDLGSTLNAWEWNWLMPAALVFALFLPVRQSAMIFEKDEEPPFFAWRSFPVLALLAWVAGTCVHLYCISYVYGLPWNVPLLAPVLWMTAWVVWRQSEVFAPIQPSRAFQRIAALAPAAAILLAGSMDRPALAATLSALNVLAYAVVAVRNRNRFAAHLSVTSALLSFAFIPHHLIVLWPGLAIELYPLKALLIGGIISMIGWAIISPCAKIGFFGGISLSVCLAVLFPSTLPAFNLAAQIGLAFILAHSLRWNSAIDRDALLARKICGMYWLLHSIVWVAAEPDSAAYGTLACGAAVLAFYFGVRIILGVWRSPIVACVAAAVLTCGSSCLSVRILHRVPDGVLILASSFALFGLGTLAAFMKRTWLARLLSH